MDEANAVEVWVDDVLLEVVSEGISLPTVTDFIRAYLRAYYQRDKTVLVEDFPGGDFGIRKVPGVDGDTTETEIDERAWRAAYDVVLNNPQFVGSERLRKLQMHEWARYGCSVMFQRMSVGRLPPYPDSRSQVFLGVVSERLDMWDGKTPAVLG